MFHLRSRGGCQGASAPVVVVSSLKDFITVLKARPVSSHRSPTDLGAADQKIPRASQTSAALLPKAARFETFGVSLPRPFDPTKIDREYGVCSPIPSKYRRINISQRDDGDENATASALLSGKVPVEGNSRGNAEFQITIRVEPSRTTFRCF